MPTWAANLLLAGAWMMPALRPGNVAEFVVAPDRPAAVRFALDADADAPANPVRYTLRDYTGRAVASGTAEPDGRSVRVPLRCPAGYWELEFPATGQRFGVLAVAKAPGPPDAFFCIDGAMSWLVGDEALRTGLADVLARCGIAVCRERLRWAAVQPARGRLAPQPADRYGKLRRTLAARGVGVLEMFHDAPPWMGRIGRYPEDLAAAAAAWGSVAARWNDTWAALEVWNEPDIFFGADLPADQYVPLVKAVAHGCRDVGARTPLVGPVVAHYNRPWLDAAGRNGLLDLLDVASFHTYDRAPAMEGLVARYRAWLAAHGAGRLPLWITESGRPWKKGPPRPPADQDAASALDIAAKAVEARACGVAAYFAFVLPYYEEGPNNFGMTGRAGTPLRSFAAYAHLAAALAGGRYVGDLPCDDPAVRRARAFRVGRRIVVAVYTGRIDPDATVRAGIAARRVVGIDGRALPPAADGAVAVPDGLSLLAFDADALAGRLRTDTEAMRLWQAAHPARRGPLRRPGPLVLRYRFDPAAVRAGPGGYRLKAPAPPAAPVVVRAFNLSARGLRAAMEARCEPPAAKVAPAGPTEVTIAPRGHVDITWRADFRDAFATGDLARLTVLARDPAGKVLDRLVADFSGPASLEQMLKAFPRRVRLPLGRQDRWTPNAAPDAKLTLSTSPQGTWRMDVRFGKSDPWAYPYFALPPDVSLAGAVGLLLRARCRGAATVRVFCWEGDRGVGYLTGGGILPADGTWHAALVRFEDLAPSGANRPDSDGRLDLAAVRRISIGLNSHAAQNTLEVSDLYIVGRE